MRSSLRVDLRRNPSESPSFKQLSSLPTTKVVVSGLPTARSAKALPPESASGIVLRIDPNDDLALVVAHVNEERMQLGLAVHGHLDGAVAGRRAVYPARRSAEVRVDRAAHR